MLLEKYDPQSSGSIFSSQASTADQQTGRPSITKLPRISHTPSIQNSSHNTDLLPSQNRPTVTIPNIEKASPLFVDNPVGRGPKIYTKNLPDVFTSGSTVNRNKKFHGIRERNQADDGEQSSMHVGTPTVHSKKAFGQPFISPARVGQIPSLKAGRKTNDPFDMNMTSMKENIEGYSLRFGNISPRKDLKQFRNERNGVSPFQRNNKIRIRTNIEYGSIFDNNTNTVIRNNENKENDGKKPAKKVVVVKKSNTSDSKFFDENNEEVKIKLVDKSSMLGSIPILQLNELITIKKVKNTMRNGVIKRMLHVPSFKMFDVLEEATADISPKENNDIRAWITNWKTSFQRSQRVSKVYACFWNSPEGCVSVVCETAKNGFLSDVIEQHGSLPEKAIQNVAKGLLEGISEIHSKIYKPHGNITPREILIDSKGGLKITPAISSMFPNAQKPDSKSPRAVEGILFRPSLKSQPQNDVNSMRPWTSLSSAVDYSQDIFDFGFTLLQCALGDFSVFDMNSPISLENIKPILTQLSLQRKSDCCCLIHSEDLVRKYLSTNSASVSSGRRHLNNNYGRKRNRLLEDLENSFHSETPYISLHEALVSMNRFSEGFVDLLCGCLKFDRDQRLKAEELLEHKFFSEGYQVKGPLVSFNELVGLGSKTPGNVLKSIENENDSGLNKLAEALRMVLLNRHVKEKFDLIMKRRGKNQPDDKALMELAGELGVSYHKLKKKLNESLIDLQD